MSYGDAHPSPQMGKVPVLPDPPTPERRLLPHLGRQLIVHAHVVSVLCYMAGVVAVLLLPLLAKTTYISENALMPGSASPMFGNSDTLDARASAAKLKTLMSQSIPQEAHREVSRWLVKQMGDLGSDCYLHPFFPRQSASLAGYVTLSPHFKWLTTNRSQTDHLERHTGLGVNVVGIIRAPQGEGNEAIVLVTPFNSEDFGLEDGLSLGIGLALFARLSRALWIARDIIWIVADAKYGAYSAVSEWLRDYHEPRINDFSTEGKLRLDLVKEFFLKRQYPDEEDLVSLSDFKRAGTIATGLVFELKVTPGGTGDTLKIRTEGPNGQMPNLDLVNIINSIAVWRESLSLQLESLPGLNNRGWLNCIGHVLEKVSNLGRQVNPTWSFASGAAAYPDTLATLLSSIFYQVIGLPTGAHGAFRDFQIDAVSLQLPVSPTVYDYSLTKFARLLEGVLRCVNNLLEKWHQSFFLYFLSSPNKYISVGVYMQPFALLLVSLPLTAVALCFPANGKDVNTKSLNRGSSVVKENIPGPEFPDSGVDKSNAEGNSAARDSKWLQALLLVSSVQTWAFFVAMILFLTSQTNFSPRLKLSVWLIIVAVSLKVSLGVPDFFSSSVNIFNPPWEQGYTQFWVAVKALTLGVTSIGLAVMSTINCPVALVGALILVPMCVGVFPLQYSWNYAKMPGKSVLTLSTLAAGAFTTIISFPPCLAWLVWSLGASFWTLSPANLWFFLESLLSWHSALLPYFLVIHLPCSVLCLYILFSTHQLNK